MWGSFDGDIGNGGAGVISAISIHKAIKEQTLLLVLLYISLL
jgi:hypothetical protein